MLYASNRSMRSPSARVTIARLVSGRLPKVRAAAVAHALALAVQRVHLLDLDVEDVCGPRRGSRAWWRRGARGTCTRPARAAGSDFSLTIGSMMTSRGSFTSSSSASVFENEKPPDFSAARASVGVLGGRLVGARVAPAWPPGPGAASSLAAFWRAASKRGSGLSATRLHPVGGLDRRPTSWPGRPGAGSAGRSPCRQPPGVASDGGVVGAAPVRGRAGRSRAALGRAGASPSADGQRRRG